MTGKRFHFGYVLGDTGLIDENTNEWFIENCCSASDLKKNWITVCDKLNTISDENEQYKLIIRESYLTERTMLGKSVLRQLAERIGVDVE